MKCGAVMKAPLSKGVAVPNPRKAGEVQAALGAAGDSGLLTGSNHEDHAQGDSSSGQQPNSSFADRNFTNPLHVWWRGLITPAMLRPHW